MECLRKKRVSRSAKKSIVIYTGLPEEYPNFFSGRDVKRLLISV